MLDAHCHIDLYQDPYQIALDAECQRIYTLAVTRLPSHFLEAQSQLSGFRYVRPALGFHPLLAAGNVREVSKLENLIHLTKYIGEVGLDFSVPDEGERKHQVEVFEYILSLTRGQDKVFSIHSRKAESQVLDLLIQYDCAKCVFHWYSGSLPTLQKIIEHGFYLSINQKMLNTNTGRRIIQSIPTNRILTETDGPFIRVDGRAIQPTDIKQTEIGLAEIWRMNPQQVTQIISENFKRLLTVNAYAVASA
ncbi:MAG: TatD DNase family protein [Acidobacteriota bacterium]|jgi:TatD DNase family protein|nr:TatD DNase family protein [Acidobacteriota bacterium]